jgi:uncharacterized protein (TIRG00374 family)
MPPKRQGKGIAAMKRALQLFGPVLFVVILATVVDFSRALQIASSLRPGAVFFALLLFLPLIVVQTARWWIVCRQLNIALSFSTLFQIYYISWFLGSLPLSGAAAASKALYLKSEGVAMDRAAASVVIDKLLDLFGVLGFALFGLAYLPHRHLAGLFSGWIYIAAGGAIVLALFRAGVLKMLWARIESILTRKFGARMPAVSSIMAGFRNNTGPLQGMVHLAFIVGIGLFRGAVLYVLALSLGLNVSFWLMVACRSLIGLVNIVPVSVSGLGTRDAVLLLVLPLWGVSEEAAVALGFLAFLWTVATKLTGVVFWLRRHR